MTEAAPPPYEAKVPPPPTALPPPKRWQPEMVARLILGQADRYEWMWMVGKVRGGGLVISSSDLPPDTQDVILRVAMQCALKQENKKK